MGAKGKINASKVQAGDRIIVLASKAEGRCNISQTKTGEGVHVARVIRKDFRSAQGRYERQGRYIVQTTSGTFEAAPVETMWLAPEDAAGIKRARVEAEVEDAERTAEREALAEDTERAATNQTPHPEHDGATRTAKDAYGDAYRQAGNRDGALALLHDAAVAYAEEDECADCGRSLTDPTEHCAHCGDHIDGLGVCQGCGDEELTLHSQAGKVDNMNNASDTETTPAPPTVGDDLMDEAKREDWARGKVAAAGKSWDTNLVKFDGTVLPRETTENYTGSTVVRILEKVWERIREDHVDLPEVVIITGSGLVGASKWGHFRADGWKVKEEGAALRKHELFLAGEALAKGARQVLQTMLHEGAHTLAQVRGIKDTSRQHRWHNAAFKKLAEEMGLEHKASQADSSHGYSFVTLTTETAERYADLLAELDAEIKLTCHLPAWLGGTTEGDEDKGGEKITGKPTQGQDEGKAKSGPLKATCQCDEPLIIRLSQKVLDMRVVRCDECESLFTAA